MEKVYVVATSSNDRRVEVDGVFTKYEDAEKCYYNMIKDWERFDAYLDEDDIISNGRLATVIAEDDTLYITLCLKVIK